MKNQRIISLFFVSFSKKETRAIFRVETSYPPDNFGFFCAQGKGRWQFSEELVALFSLFIVQGAVIFLYENIINLLKYNKKAKAGGALELGFI